MLYVCFVTSVCDYAHDVISFPQYSGSDQIHTKAIRSYLGVGRSANLCAIRYAISLLEPRSRASIKMLRFYFRLLNINIYLNVIYIILATWSRFVRLLSNFNLFPIMICLIHFVRSLLFLASPSGPITSSSDLKAIYSQGNQLCTLWFKKCDNMYPPTWLLTPGSLHPDHSCRHACHHWCWNFLGIAQREWHSQKKS